MFPLNIKLMIILAVVAFALYTFSKKYTIVRKGEKKSKPKVKEVPVKIEIQEEDEEEKES